jgi:OPT family oligopeptide transporter
MPELESAVATTPYVPAKTRVAELTVKSILLGSFFGLLFGAATVYLGLKAGLTISASIPVAVLAISLGRKFFKTTILENNIIQTTASAGESIAGGVVFTMPGFLFLSSGSHSENFFSYWPIFILAAIGGMLGTLMMIPLRRALIVEEHGTLPYPEGTACASVLIAGEKGGDFALTAYKGFGFALVYAACQKIFALIAEIPGWVTAQTNRFFPSATVNADITPEYMGVGYIIGPRIGGVLVSGGVLAWLGLIPLLASLLPPEIIAAQQVKLGYLHDLATAGGKGGWNPASKTFADTAAAIYFAYVRQIGAGAVAAGGFVTLLKTLPTIWSSLGASLAALKKRSAGISEERTEDDLSIRVVGFGCLALIILMMLLPQIPGDSIVSKCMLGILIILFGFVFVSVSSRITGLIGTSSNPISGMTIATIMGTCLVFLSIGWSGFKYEPLVLVVGSMICIAAANGGGTSQDLKTGFLVGSTPRYQQLSLFVGAIVAAVAIGLTVKLLDAPSPEMVSQGVLHRIGTNQYPAPQGTLMATLIKGLLSFNLDWQFVLVGAFLAVTMELCAVNSLCFAVGAYLPLSTTLPIFVGSAIRGVVDRRTKKAAVPGQSEELKGGNLFATGLVAGGAIAGVIVAGLMQVPGLGDFLPKLNLEKTLTTMLGENGYNLLGVAFFAVMGIVLFRIGASKKSLIEG